MWLLETGGGRATPSLAQAWKSPVAAPTTICRLALGPGGRVGRWGPGSEPPWLLVFSLIQATLALLATVPQVPWGPLGPRGVSRGL